MKNKKLVFNLLLGVFLGVLPFVYSKVVADPALTPRQIYLTGFVLLIGLVVFFQALRKQLVLDFSVLRSVLPITAVLFAAAVGLSLFQSILISESYYAWSKVLIEVAFFLLITCLMAWNKLDRNAVIKAVLIFIAGILVAACIQILGLLADGKDLLMNVHKINGHTANKNLLSSILFLGFPFLVNALTLNKWWKISSLILMILTVIIIGLVQTKAVFGAFAVFAVLFSSIILCSRILKKNFFSKKIAAIVLGGFVLVFCFGAAIMVKYQEKFSNTFNKSSWVIRFELWENTVKMVEEYPVFGVGANNWKINFPKYGLSNIHVKKVQDAKIVFQRPHNDFLWVFSETGIIGFIPFLGLFLVGSFYAIRILLKTTDKKDFLWAGSLLAALWGFLFISAFDFPFERIEHQILFFLILACLTALNYAYFSKQSATNSSGVIPKTIIGLALLSAVTYFSFTVAFHRYAGEEQSKKIYAANKGKKWKKVIKEVDLAKSKYYEIDPTGVPLASQKAMAYVGLEDLETALPCFQEGYRQQPYSIVTINNLASCYQRLNYFEEAEEMYLKALSISPEYEESLLNLSAVYFNRKDYRKAFEYIDQCPLWSAGPRYRMFLEGILYHVTTEIITQETDLKIIQKLKAFQAEKDKLYKIYVDSKKQEQPFESYLVKQCRTES